MLCDSRLVLFLEWQKSGGELALDPHRTRHSLSLDDYKILSHLHMVTH
jgi:hypothetical protein